MRETSFTYFIFCFQVRITHSCFSACVGVFLGARGSIVEAQCYEPEGYRFDSV
jgi:hypothetical protein